MIKTNDPEGDTGNSTLIMKYNWITVTYLIILIAHCSTITELSTL